MQGEKDEKKKGDEKEEERLTDRGRVASHKMVE
jgi:hypothetical protein